MTSAPEVRGRYWTACGRPVVAPQSHGRARACFIIEALLARGISSRLFRRWGFPFDGYERRPGICLSTVIGSYPAGEQAVAHALGVHPAQLWPEHYDEIGRRHTSRDWSATRVRFGTPEFYALLSRPPVHSVPSFPSFETLPEVLR